MRLFRYCIQHRKNKRLKFMGEVKSVSPTGALAVASREFRIARKNLKATPAGIYWAVKAGVWPPKPKPKIESLA